MIRHVRMWLFHRHHAVTFHEPATRRVVCHECREYWT